MDAYCHRRARFHPFEKLPEPGLALAYPLCIVVSQIRDVATWQEIGGAPMVMKPDAMRGLLAVETTKWKKVITGNKITAGELQ
jgi:hypothetical protein